mmetsp:Transcript_65242/g.187873  ORF Transcript_65242/g.187873 Transcript_65242/m.187873 type:complete len:230 (-) Transcript_65242:919-1608(-)
MRPGWADKRCRLPGVPSRRNVAPTADSPSPTSSGCAPGPRPPRATERSWSRSAARPANAGATIPSRLSLARGSLSIPRPCHRWSSRPSCGSCPRRCTWSSRVPSRPRPPTGRIASTPGRAAASALAPPADVADAARSKPPPSSYPPMTCQGVGPKPKQMKTTASATRPASWSQGRRLLWVHRRRPLRPPAARRATPGQISRGCACTTPPSRRPVRAPAATPRRASAKCA